MSQGQEGCQGHGLGMAKASLRHHSTLGHVPMTPMSHGLTSEPGRALRIPSTPTQGSHQLPTSQGWQEGFAWMHLPLGPADRQSPESCPGYLQVAKGQAISPATISPALVVDPVKDGEAVQAMALQGTQLPQQPGEQVVSGGPGAQRDARGQPPPLLAPSMGSS